MCTFIEHVKQLFPAECQFCLHVRSRLSKTEQSALKWFPLFKVCTATAIFSRTLKHKNEINKNNVSMISCVFCLGKIKYLKGNTKKSKYLLHKLDSLSVFSKPECTDTQVSTQRTITL